MGQDWLHSSSSWKRANTEDLNNKGLENKLPLVHHIIPCLYSTTTRDRTRRPRRPKTPVTISWSIHRHPTRLTADGLLTWPLTLRTILTWAGVGAWSGSYLTIIICFSLPWTPTSIKTFINMNSKWYLGWRNWLGLEQDLRPEAHPLVISVSIRWEFGFRLLMLAVFMNRHLLLAIW